MKINNVGLNLGQKNVNPFRTSRNSTTNPFQNVSFEGRTLDLEFADVFEAKKISKMKMISSSVAGSMNKIRSSIAEPIINFVNRVREGVSNAWNYAKNTNISDVAGIKNISEALSNINMPNMNIGKNISESMSNIGKSISDKMSFLNTDVTEIGKGLSDKWCSLISRVNIHHNKITKDTSVAELRTMWQNELNNMSESEAA